MTAVWDGFTVGPDDWLILVVRPGISPAEVVQAKSRIPTALHGRVLLVDGFDGYVVHPSDDDRQRMAAARAELDGIRQPADTAATTTESTAGPT